jgi:class I fructose-bisphosphate aldolase
MPKHSPKDASQPKPYAGMEFTYEEGARRVVASAGRCLVLFSGGGKLGDDDVLEKARVAMEAGSVGLIFGRNMWERPWKEALGMTSRLQNEVLSKFPG